MYAALDEGGGPYRGTPECANGGRRSIETSSCTRSSPTVCEMRDGALTRMFFYSSHADALDAVGCVD
jgi:hypothetical protein